MPKKSSLDELFEMDTKEVTTKDIDKPAGYCPTCKLPIAISIVSQRWIVSCNCATARDFCKVHNKEIEDSWKIPDNRF